MYIYGDGPDKSSLIDLTKKLTIEDYVHFPGYVKDVLGVLDEASIFVMSSNYEGMPNSLMEAMAVGLPVISTDCPCGGPRYLIKDMENGLLIPTNDLEKLTEALKLLISNEKLRVQLGFKAHEICTRLSPETVYGRWERVISDL